VTNPDLSKIDEIGFADLIPGSGYGQGGYIQLGGTRSVRENGGALELLFIDSEVIRPEPSSAFRTKVPERLRQGTFFFYERYLLETADLLLLS